jgi:hypothetical protein
LSAHYDHKGNDMLAMTRTLSSQYRKLTPYEWIYRSVAESFPPFVIQLKIELSSLPTHHELENAVAKAAAVNPGSRLVAHGRWWEDTYRNPRIRIVPPTEPYSLSCAWVQSSINFDEAPPLEVLHWDGVGLIFRCVHALMDAGGLIFFAQETFRALRGESLLGSTTDKGDWQYLRELNHPRSRRIIWPDMPSPLGKPISGCTGFTWRQKFVPGRVDSAAARIASAVANLHPEQSTRLGCRIMIPVDLRLWHPTLRSTANFSNPLFVRSLPGGKWSDCYREILTGLYRHDEHAVSPLDILISKIPKAAIAWLFVTMHEWQVRNDRYFCSALSSNIGLVRLKDFRLRKEEPSSIAFLPFNAPGTALTLLTIQHDHGLEIAASSPYATGGEGRLDKALDEICDELSRGAARCRPFAD